MRETKYNQNKFDRKAPIDRDALWGKISTDPKFPKPEPKSRKRFWIIWSLVLLFLASALTYTFTKMESRDTDEKDLSSLNNKIGDRKNDQNSTLKSQTSQFETLDTDIDTSVKNVNIKSNTKVNSNKETTQIADLNNQNTAVKLSSNEQLSAITQVSKNRKKAKREITQINKSANNTIFESLKSNLRTSQTSTQGQSTTPRGTIKSKSELQVSDQNNTLNGLQTHSNPISALSALTFDKLETKEISLPQYTETLIPLKSRLGLLIYLNASYGLSINSVSSPDTLSFSDVFDTSQYLENRESRAIEFGIKKQVFKRFNVGLGAEYREDWQVYKRTTIDTLITAIPDEGGRIGLAEVTTNYKLPQSYKSLNLLVTAGYLIPTQIGILEIGGGLTYNLGIGWSGNLLDNEFQIIARTRVYELRNFGLAGFGQASFTLPLSEQLRLSINARYDIPTLISGNGERYEHQLSALRLGVGLGYAF